MTKIKFLLFALLCGVLTLQMTSCSSGDDDNNDDGGGNPTVTGITVAKTSTSIQVGKTETLGVSLQPLGVTGNVTWSSSDATVASVNNSGVVTANKVGTATIAAAIGAYSATCTVTVTAEPVVATDNSLTGSDYFVIQMDDVSLTSLGAKVIKDLRPNETDKFLYVWEGTFTAGTPAGANFYGQSAGWPSLVVASVGWSGAGWNVAAASGSVDMTRMATNPGDYYLHIGYKTSQSGRPLAFTVSDADATAKFAIGGDFADNGTSIKSLAAINADGKWHGVDIPVTKLNELGVFFNKAWTDKNIIAVLAGGTAGTTVDLDAIFFYKK